MPAGPAESPAFAFLLVSAVAGLLAGACSLLLLLPPDRMMLPGSVLAHWADNHAPLVLLGSAVPALLGGVGFLLLPPAIGARGVACPAVARGAAILLAVSVVGDLAAPLLAAPTGSAFVEWLLERVALSGFVLSALGCVLPLLATLLNHGDAAPRPARLFPVALATGCVMAPCVLPVLLAGFWHGTAAGQPDRVASVLAWPVLMIVLPPAIGLVVDVLGGDRAPEAVRRSGWSLAIGAALGFICWCAPRFGHGAVLAPDAKAAFLMPAVAVLLLGAIPPRPDRLLAPSRLHAAGMVLVVLLAVLGGIDGPFPLHYLLSAGISLALCCGLFVFLEETGSGTASRRIGQLQFLFLFAGLHLMLLPSARAPAAGAACCALSLVLLAGLVAAMLLPGTRRLRVPAR